MHVLSQPKFSRLTAMLLLVSSGLLLPWACPPSPALAQAQGERRMSDADLLEEKLQLIDERGQSQGKRSFVIRATSSVVRPKDNYGLYQKLAAALVAKLLRVKAESERQVTPYSLQRLAAITHSVTVENEALHVAMEGEESRYQSYRLILRAVNSLEEATQYWRQSNEAQTLGRGSRENAQMDQDIVRLKLQTAMGAIEELKEFEQLKKTLDQNIRD